MSRSHTEQRKAGSSRTNVPREVQGTFVRCLHAGWTGRGMPEVREVSWEAIYHPMRNWKELNVTVRTKTQGWIKEASKCAERRGKRRLQVEPGKCEWEAGIGNKGVRSRYTAGYGETRLFSNILMEL